MENLHIVVGNLGADPEKSALPDGTVKTTFSVASSETWTDKSGELQEATEWHNIVAFGKLGDVCAKHLAEGRLVYIRGSHHTDRWKKDEVWQSYNYIKARKVRFLDKGKK